MTIISSANIEYETARMICGWIQHQGFIAYLAGGCVRDGLLRRTPKDYDIASDIDPELLKAKYHSFDGGGDKYGVTHLLVNGFKFEVAMFRSDGDYTDGRRPDSVEKATPEDDAGRRDFTINAIFYDPVEEKYIDYVGGKEDLLVNRVLRTVGNPHDRFEEDRLRMMRYARFAATFPKLALSRAAVYRMAERNFGILGVSNERIRDEMMKMLHAEDPVRGLELLRSTGILRHFLQEVVDFHGCTQPEKFHPEGDVWQHTMAMLSRLRERGRQVNEMFPLAVLLHDIGKPKVRYIGEDDGLPHFLQHEFAGLDMAENVMRRLCFSVVDIEYVRFMIEFHMVIRFFKTMKTSKKKRLARSPYFRDLLELHYLDCVVTGKPTDLVDWAHNYADNLSDEQLHPIPLIKGRDLIELGLTPGPLFKRILGAIETQQLEENITTRESALAFARTFTEDEANGSEGPAVGKDDAG